MGTARSGSSLVLFSLPVGFAPPSPPSTSPPPSIHIGRGSHSSSPTLPGLIATPIPRSQKSQLRAPLSCARKAFGVSQPGVLLSGLRIGSTPCHDSRIRLAALDWVQRWGRSACIRLPVSGRPFVEREGFLQPSRKKAQDQSFHSEIHPIQAKIIPYSIAPTLRWLFRILSSSKSVAKAVAILNPQTPLSGAQAQ
ncbi:hypothetical protein DFH27DRAFT_7682 [Peziza echinospora]|nr:hypothetical protein DFH27DRAFT_7682 [Peziza echinospora]